MCVSLSVCVRSKKKKKSFELYRFQISATDFSEILGRGSDMYVMLLHDHSNSDLNQRSRSEGYFTTKHSDDSISNLCNLSGSNFEGILYEVQDLHTCLS